ncbi:MAG: PhzF family phenazine biosynthesis protein [Actinomycetota bacterium]
MRFLQVDVFCRGPYTGNPLAVFPEAADLDRSQMQKIASEMNLSESTFVTHADSDSYRVRIFTPRQELPFAGHPTLGTTWVLRHLGLVTAEEVIQESQAGQTVVRVEGERLWFARTGRSGADIEEAAPSFRRLAHGLALEPRDLGLEARELGRNGMLLPAVSGAGIDQLIVPVRDADTLLRCAPAADLAWDEGVVGFYCFTATQAGRLQARGFFPSLGIAEDPATGSAAASLGVYLAHRLGDIDVEIAQGEQVGRPSTIYLDAEEQSVRVGGRCAHVLTGALEQLP